MLVIILCFICHVPVSLGADGKDRADKPLAKAPAPRETRMKASGVVKDITRTTLVIERNITGEVMEFQLEKDLSGISVGDKVAVSYIQVDGRNIAKRVIKNLPKQKSVSPPVPSRNSK